MEVILSILVALFGIGFGIFMALQPENVIALRSRRRYTQVPEPTEEYIPADPAKIPDHFFQLLLAFFVQQLCTHPVRFSQCKILIHLAPP